MKKLLCFVLALVILSTCFTFTVYPEPTTYTVFYDDFSQSNLAERTINDFMRRLTVGITPNNPANDRYGNVTYAMGITGKEVTEGGNTYTVYGDGEILYHVENVGGKTLSVLNMYIRDLIFQYSNGWGNWEAMTRRFPIKIYAGATSGDMKLLDISGFKDGGAGNHMYVEYLVESLPQNTNYIKIVLPEWYREGLFNMRQIGRVEITEDPQRMENCHPAMPDLYADSEYATLQERYNGAVFEDRCDGTLSPELSSLSRSDYYLVLNGSCGTILGQYSRNNPTRAASVTYENDVFANQGLAVVMLYDKALVDRFTGRNTWSDWQSMTRERPINIYAGPTSNDLRLVAPTHFMISGVGNDMSIEWIVDELAADTKVVRIEIPRYMKDSTYSPRIARVVATKKERLVQGSYAAIPGVFEDQMWFDDGFKVFDSPAYRFSDNEGTAYFNPVSGGKTNVSCTVEAEGGAFDSVTMISAAFDKDSRKLMAVGTDSKAATGRFDMNCELTALPEDVSNLIFKTYFWTETDSIKPLTDNTYPYIAREGGHKQNSVYVVSPDLRSDVYGDNVVIKAFTRGVESVSLSCMHQPDASHPNPYGYEKVFAEGLIPNEEGYVEAVFPASEFPYGPVSVKVKGEYINKTQGGTGVGSRFRPARHGETAAASYTFYLQLYNNAGVKWNVGLQDIPTPPAAQGMVLKYYDDFDDPDLSISDYDSSQKYYSHTYGIDANGNSYSADFGSAGFRNYGSEADPFMQKDSYMRIRAMKNRKTRGYEAGLIASEFSDKKSVNHSMAYWECRILCPPGAGTWPAFWLLSSKNNPPGASGAEIDILEGYGYLIDKPTFAWHDWTKTKNNGGGSSVFLSTLNKPDTAAAFHTYAAKVTAENIYYYIDDVQVWSHKTSLVPQATSPMYFLINLALGPWPVFLRNYDEAVDMYVDYVRVYEPE